MCCTCHAKRAGWAPNAAPVTQTEAAPNVINRCPTSADPHEGAPSAVPATQNEPEVLTSFIYGIRRCENDAFVRGFPQKVKLPSVTKTF